jgi:hypothetical protein
MTDREQFEAHIKNAAWYRVLSEAAKDDDEGASVFRMARMAASEAWNASRRASLDESATCEHEWLPMAQPHKECFKCGDVRPDGAVAKHPTDTVSRWVFDAYRINLEALHALCMELGCQQGDTVADWLRSRLSAQPAPSYCIRHADGLRWRTLDSMGMPEWTTDEAEALCFSLRHHADAFACDDPDDVRIVPRP